ncbi:MAG: ATP-binding cassette domain-containing protein [Verrucomicrobia bacterium]|nr:ATP-binding cassette domain-containing protein [Verrucomicrobiota bacterium]MBU6446047.1 ATP-binding cassette domain-containing protein [Verrucomicrobiota bacterium]MDE3047920.1 ATP-binding cassette domain-containing protein [Verrucomicrobiota bacterium]
MIRIKNLWKRYSNVDVLRGLNLEVHQGEILVILGRSGVGKSVLLRHIIGIEKPDQGSIEIDGVNITHLKKNQIYHAVRNMGMLFQGSALFDSMNIEENTAFYLKQHRDIVTKKRLEPEVIQVRVQEALKMVGLEGAGHKMPSDLSGGMRKRAGLARLIVYRPSILLYDEPTTGLDPITAQQINELIVTTQNELKGTSIVVTHDLHSALFMADRLALHQEGQIIHVSEPETFMNIDHPTINFLRENQQLKRKQPS